MESVKTALMKRIGEAMPEVRIDEDYGQLENVAEQYPAVYPCVLIGQGETEWKTMSNRPSVQQGVTPVTLRLAVDCYEGVHGGAPIEQQIAAREQLAERLFRTVQGMRLTGEISALDRRSSTEYALGGGIKVYEMTFEYLVRTTL